MSSRVVILGGGPAGLGAALGLAERGFAVDVVERGPAVGGNAGSFEIAGLRVDYGSHRLHPSTDPAILARLQGLLGDDLRVRPRHGRILLSGRWVHFPLRPVDFAVRAPPRFLLGLAADVAGRVLPARSIPSRESFASVLERALGPTICRQFYFPYARKIWGVDPDELSPEQARRRVSAGSIGKLVRRLLTTRRHADRTGPSKHHFYYPRRGFGQISERLRDAAVESGARLWLSTSVRRVSRRPGGGLEVTVQSDERIRDLAADQVWSTIPIITLARLSSPAPPPDVLDSASALSMRAMILVYVVLGQDRFTEYDAHYFPGPEIPFTRLSEPKNYSGLEEPRGRTVLCAEIPCSREDDVWELDEEQLGDLVLGGLERVGLEVDGPVLQVVCRRLTQAYPIYRSGYELPFRRLDEWVDALDGVISFGRQGLFAHDNTHHALYMAQAAVSCLSAAGHFDRRQWSRFREQFKDHVVED